MSNCYWSVPSVSSQNRDGGFGKSPVTQDILAAKEFFHRHFSQARDLPLQKIDQQLWELRQAAIAQADFTVQTGAELCLRCRIPWEIQKSCRELATRFQEQQIAWDELFACLPDDDGQSLNRKGSISYQPFTLEVLHAYDPHRNGQVSLAKLVQRMVRQNQVVLQYLLDHGILLRSDWALLNRASLSGLAAFEAAIVKVFHTVYRDYRRRQHTSRTDGKCPPPTPEQLQKMLELLQKQGIQIESQTVLLQHLTTIARVLRNQEIAKLGGFPISGPLSGFEPEGTDMVAEIPDESVVNNPVEAMVQKAFQAFCDQMQQRGWNLEADVDFSLEWGVEKGICDRISLLKSKAKQNHLVEQYEQGLYLTYCQGLTQTEIGDQWQMDQYKVSTLLKLKELNQQRIPDHAVEKLFRQIVQMIQPLQLSIDTSTPEYKRELIPVIHEFLAPIFREAEAERRNPKNRQMNGRLAKHIQTFLKSRRS
jgi:hypothetical protein